MHALVSDLLCELAMVKIKKKIKYENKKHTKITNLEYNRGRAGDRCLCQLSIGSASYMDMWACARVCTCVCACARVCARVCACARVWVPVRVCVRVCVLCRAHTRVIDLEQNGPIQIALAQPRHVHLKRRPHRVRGVRFGFSLMHLRMTILLILTEMEVFPARIIPHFEAS